MYETKNIDILLMSDMPSDDHVNVAKKFPFLQHRLSTQRLSNICTELLLKNAWETNRVLNTKTGEDISNSVKLLAHNSDKSNVKFWKSSLSSIDPIAFFEKSLPNCMHCYQDKIGFEEICQLQNSKCCCHLKLHEPTNVNQSDNTHGMKQSCLIKTLSSQGSDNESKSAEDNRQLFRPKFGRPKLKPHLLSSSKCVPIYQDVDLTNEEDTKSLKSNVAKITFKTAKEQLLASNPAAKRTLGTSKKAQGKFVSPMIGAQEKQEITEPEVTEERLRHIDPKMIELIESEIIDKGTPIGWDDIAGLQMAKSVIQEAVVWPLLRPDIFTGLRRPPKGILLFGPPGTGKTLIGKCVAAQCNATFFSISASSLTSKWIGDGEKMVRALFAVARCHQPAVIFIDEIDSLLTQRNDTEHEATRRIKTEFLVQFDGAATGEEDRILIVGATNRPQELDEAARRRLVKRLYIPLPDADARKQIIANLLKTENNDLSAVDVEEVAGLTDGYSGADMKSLCSEAAMGPIRSVPLSQIISIDRHKVRPVNIQDFRNALQRVRPSVSQDDLGQYVKWNTTYGQGFQ